MDLPTADKEQSAAFIVSLFLFLASKRRPSAIFRLLYRPTIAS